MRLTWGLNPLANEFQPQQHPIRQPVAPVSTSSLTTMPPVTVHPPSQPVVQPNYQYNKVRPRAPLYMEQHASYHAPQQHFSDVRSMHSTAPLPVNNPMVYGSQQSV